MPHCDDILDAKAGPRALLRFLRYHRWPATYQCRAIAMGIKRPDLYATLDGKWVRVTMASRFGDVGINTNLLSQHSYNDRVDCGDLSDFTDVRPE